MTQDQIKAIQSLRDSGYAIAIFTPEELADAPIEDVEDRMIENGWEVIHFSSN